MQAILLAATLLAGCEAFNEDPFYNPTKPHGQRSTDSYNLLKYTGWQGPYSDRRGVGINRDAPDGTHVDQVIMYMRHGERWPDAYDWAEQLTTLKKFDKLKGQLKGSVAFANDWIPFATNANYSWLSEESLVGPYSGLLHAYNFGAEARRRYFNLYDGESTLPLFASGYERIVDTARKFGEGFLQWNYTDVAAVNIIPEVASQGADTLVPVCHAKEQTKCAYPKNTTEVNSPWLYPQYDVAAKRLNLENPGLNLNASDIPHLLGTAAFELNVRGSSPWASVFTSEEWVTFGYSQTTYYYCFYGPGSTTGPSGGSLALNASRVLLLEGPEGKSKLPLVFNFAHDTNLIALAAALGINEEESWNGYEVNFETKYSVNDLTPQGAHIIFERLVADTNLDEELELLTEWDNHYPAGAFNTTGNITASAGSKPETFNTTLGKNVTATTGDKKSGTPDVYVRVVINEAVVPLDTCKSGPGFSCPLDEFNELVNERLSKIPSFDKFCNVSASAPQYLSFYWNYSTSNKYNHKSGILSQSGLLDANDKPIKEE